MKKLIITGIVTLGFIISCSNVEVSSPVVESDTDRVYNIRIIDNCEYLEYDRGITQYRVYSLTHKGNCKNHPRTTYLK